VSQGGHLLVPSRENKDDICIPHQFVFRQQAVQTFPIGGAQNYNRRFLRQLAEPMVKSVNFLMDLYLALPAGLTDNFQESLANIVKQFCVKQNGH